MLYPACLHDDTKDPAKAAAAASQYLPEVAHRVFRSVLRRTIGHNTPRLLCRTRFWKHSLLSVFFSFWGRSGYCNTPVRFWPRATMTSTPVLACCCSFVPTRSSEGYPSTRCLPSFLCSSLADVLDAALAPPVGGNGTRKRRGPREGGQADHRKTDSKIRTLMLFVARSKPHPPSPGHHVVFMCWHWLNRIPITRSPLRCQVWGVFLRVPASLRGWELRQRVEAGDRPSPRQEPPFLP